MLVGSVSMAKRYCRISRAQENILKNIGPAVFLFWKAGTNCQRPGRQDRYYCRSSAQNDIVVSLKIGPACLHKPEYQRRKALADVENIENHLKT